MTLAFLYLSRMASAMVKGQGTDEERLRRLPSWVEADHVRRVITDVVQVEGPVHFERVARLVAACFELTRLNQDRIDWITRQIPVELRKDRSEPFAWPTTIDPDA